MNESHGLPSTGTAPMPDEFSQGFSQDHAVTVASAGALLRQARESAGLHIAALAVALKVPVKKLEAMEADRFDLLPDAVFVRALAASVCRTLKIDATPVMALLPQTGKPTLGQHATINTPFRAPGDGRGPSLLGQLSKPIVLAVLVLVLAALVLVFLPAVQQPTADGQAAESVSAGDGIAAPTVFTPTGTPMPAGENALGEGAVIVPAAASAVSPEPAPVPAPAELVAPAAGPVAPAVVATPAPTATGGLVVFKATGESWVEVTDARGVVILRRLLKSGEEAGASGALPLAAVVGRADATQVQVRGQAFDLGAVSRDNVARFEVK